MIFDGGNGHSHDFSYPRMAYSLAVGKDEGLLCARREDIQAAVELAFEILAEKFADEIVPVRVVHGITLYAAAIKPVTILGVVFAGAQVVKAGIIDAPEQPLTFFFQLSFSLVLFLP